jgi:hypothetical protein
MDAATRDLVRARAGDTCEYCRLPQSALLLVTFHIEHIIARQHGGSDDPNNLAFSCHHCNLHKGPNLTGIDPASGQVVLLFNPRLDHWDDHFDRQGIAIVGRTPVGRTTVRTLAMNSTAQLKIRSKLHGS